MRVIEIAENRKMYISYSIKNCFSGRSYSSFQSSPSCIFTQKKTRHIRIYGKHFSDEVYLFLKVVVVDCGIWSNEHPRSLFKIKELMSPAAGGVAFQEFGCEFFPMNWIFLGKGNCLAQVWALSLVVIWYMRVTQFGSTLKDASACLGD